jgi:cell division protease FtsH
MTQPDTPSRSAPDRPAPPRGSLRGRFRPESPSPPPWRVEGARSQKSSGRRPNWSRFWWLLLALLVVDWIVSSVMLGPAPRTKVSYTFFTSQVDARNVKEITSTADTIEGVFNR